MARARIKMATHNLRKNDLGDVSPKELEQEAMIAFQTLLNGKMEGKLGNKTEAINLAYKSLGIAVNVITTALSRNIEARRDTILVMRDLVEYATEDIENNLISYMEENEYWYGETASENAPFPEWKAEDEKVEVEVGMNGLAGRLGNLKKARTKLRSAKSAYRQGDLRLAVSRALTAAVTAARASSGRDSQAVIQKARELIQGVAIKKLTRRRA